MNKWQIICPVAALVVAAMVIGVVAKRSQHRSVISMASRSLGSELIAATNSPHLVRMSPYLRARLEQLLSSPTHVASVLPGDEAPPIGDGSACSRLVLTNNAGQRLLLRLREAAGGRFEVVGFRSLSD
jgi:hypothetical protein